MTKCVSKISGNNSNQDNYLFVNKAAANVHLFTGKLNRVYFHGQIRTKIRSFSPREESGIQCVNDERWIFNFSFLSATNCAERSIIN